MKTSTHTIPPKTTKLEDAARLNDVQHSVTELRSGETMESLKNFSSLQEKDLLNIVTFRKGNFVQNWRPPEDKSYHTIIWQVLFCFALGLWNMFHFVRKMYL